ncbi:unnamed protein product, partial [Discosporangium mesarthrocarpum]
TNFEPKVELVLTAHPTEINRRTLLAKHKEVSHRLEQLDMLEGQGGGSFDKDQTLKGLERAVEAIWNSDEVRRQKPTPQDEARAGLAVIEQ